MQPKFPCQGLGAFSEAERDGLIPNNPCRHARMPARGMAAELGHEMQVWEAPTLRRFLESPRVNGTARCGDSSP